MEHIAPEQANALLQDHKALLFDIRSEAEFAQGHVPGAILVPDARIDPQLVSVLDDKHAIFYCTSGARTARACDTIESVGLKNARLLEGGLNAWQSSGLPVIGSQAGSGALSVPRQVQITVGTLIVLFAVLAWMGMTFAPYVLGAIGLGLLTAGLTGTCALATVIMMMPWNRAKSGG